MTTGFRVVLVKPSVPISSYIRLCASDAYIVAWNDITETSSRTGSVPLESCYLLHRTHYHTGPPGASTGIMFTEYKHRLQGLRLYGNIPC